MYKSSGLGRILHSLGQSCERKVSNQDLGDRTIPAQLPLGRSGGLAHNHRAQKKDPHRSPLTYKRRYKFGQTDLALDILSAGNAFEQASVRVEKIASPSPFGMLFDQASERPPTRFVPTSASPAQKFGYRQSGLGCLVLLAAVPVGILASKLLMAS